MIAIQIQLPEAEFQRLNAVYPPTVKSANVGDRAIEIVQFHFRAEDPQCQFRKPTDGTDLEICTAGNSVRIEVKGTAASNLAWGKLKVSGGPSYQQLLNDVPLYRVVAVYDRTPRIYVLKHSQDFEMIPEPRWRMKARNVSD